ncbi:MAG: hypothetical protein ACFBZ8_08275 [Opitutales bacterium]
MLRSFCYRALAACTGLASVSSLFAGTIRDDVPEQTYIDFGQNHPFSDAIAILETSRPDGNFASTATLISPTQVLTAAHPFLTLNDDFEIIGQASAAQVTFGVDNVNDFSGAFSRFVSAVDLLFEAVPLGAGSRVAVDLAIITLAEPVFGIDPAPLIFGTLPSLPAGSAFVTQNVGFGQFGDGVNGVTGGFGVKRGGRNLAFEVPGFDNFLFAVHDDPADNPDPSVDVPSLADEYTPLPGDSGSGLWLQDDSGEPLGIVGVTSFGFTTDEGAEVGEYSTTVGYSLTGPFVTLNDGGDLELAIPEPSMVALPFGLMAGVFVICRSRRLRRQA